MKEGSPKRRQDTYWVFWYKMSRRTQSTKYITGSLTVSQERGRQWLKGLNFLFRMKEFPEIGVMTLNILNVTKLHILNDWISTYVNYFNKDATNIPKFISYTWFEVMWWSVCWLCIIGQGLKQQDTLWIEKEWLYQIKVKKYPSLHWLKCNDV